MSEVWYSDPGLGDDRRDHRPGPGRHHDAVGADPGPVVDDQLVRAGEASPALEQGHVARLGAAAAAVRGDLVDAREDAVLNGLPVHPGQLGAEAESGRAADLGGDVGGVREDLAGDAAPQQARPAEVTGLDERDRARRGIFRHQDVAGAGSDDG